MATYTYQGTYQDGTIILDEKPDDITNGRVTVLFLAAGDDANAETCAHDYVVERLIEQMETGIDFGGEHFNREAIYDRTIIREDRTR